MTEQLYLLANIRDLLLDGFDDQELRRLCYYVPDFRSVYDELARTTGKADIVDDLIEYADNYLLIDTLLELAKERNPARYAHHGPYYRAERVAAQGKLDAIFYNEAKNVHRPEKLFGRDNLLNKVHELLDDRAQVLLCGLAGTGKTALAATAADQRITEGKGPVIWLQTGHENAEAIFDALVQHFATVEERLEISRLAVDAKIVAVGDLLGRSEASLLVLDNVWNGHALYRVLQAVPGDMSLLVTSRQRFPKRLGLEPMEVGDLQLDEALNLLGHYAGEQDYSTDEGARKLCEDLGHHAYALEIAGATLEEDDLTPDELRQQIADAPHDISMPEDFAEEGRESVKKLLDRSFDALKPEEKAVFQAFGASFAPGATSTLLATYMQRQESAVTKLLNVLVRRSLAKRRWMQESNYYHVHTLTFSYARTMFRDTEQDDQAMVVAVQRYVEEYAQDFNRLDFDQANISGAAHVARTENTQTLVAIMRALAMGGYFDARGHSQDMLDLLDEAIVAVKQKGVTEHETLHHLHCKRGNAHVNRGELAQAFEAYHAALDVAPNPTRAITLLSGIGKVCAMQEQYAEAARYFEQAHELAQAENDMEATIRVLEQQSHAAFLQKDYKAVRDLATKGIDISVRLGDRIREGYFRMNLGSAEFELGARKALEYYQEAHEIAQEEDDHCLMAETLYTLGINCHTMGNWEQARKYLDRARKLFDQLGYLGYEQEIADFMKQFGYNRS